jgi:multiple sugar transport system substrate-binding protein
MFMSGCEKENATSQKTEEPTVSEKEPVTLTMTFWGSPQEKKAVEEAAKKFSDKFPNVTVKAIHIPESDYDAKIAAMVASGQAPDYAYIHGQQGEQFAKEGKFYNWFELMEKDPEISKEDFVDDIWFRLNRDNAWAISGAVECFGLFYNKDAFNEAGLDYPPSKFENSWTWDEFVNVAKNLTIDTNGNNANSPKFDPNNIKQYGISFENWFGPVSVHVINNGGDFVLEDGKTFGYSKPEAYEAIQRLSDLINVHHVAPSPIQARAIPGQAAAIESKLAAMSMHGQWINLDLGANNVNYGIGVLPKMDKESGTLKISGAISIFKDTKHFEETWELAKFMCGEGVESLYENGLWMPTMKKYYTDQELLKKWVGPNPAHPEGFKDAMLDMVMNHSKPAMVYTIKNQSKIDAMISAALDPVWMGEKTAKEAMEELETKIQPEIKGRYDK